jgi:hypothetical protein
VGVEVEVPDDDVCVDVVAPESPDPDVPVLTVPVWLCVPIVTTDPPLPK